MTRLLLAALLLPSVALAQLQPFGVLNGTVTHVSDGDTVRLNTGHSVRLLDINTPEIAHENRPAEPLANQAKTALATMVMHQPVQVQLGARVYDPYARVLGHVYLRNGSRNAWVNGGLVRGGFAHVYTFPDNRVYGPELLQLEAKARAEKLGLWALPRWQVHGAETCCAEDDIGRFVLVRGTVKAIAKVGNRTFLNFGPDWRTDFSVVIDDKNLKFFRPQKAKGQKRRKDAPKAAPFSLNDYLGQTVLVRGVTQPVNGILVRVTHPEQIQVIQ
jgi:endonuclease YncB( thermonuclease family)